MAENNGTGRSAVEVVVVIGVGLSGLFAAFGIYQASEKAGVQRGDPGPWFLAAGVAAAVAVFVPLMYFVVHPMLVGLDARAARKLAEARAAKAAVALPLVTGNVVELESPLPVARAVQIVEARYGAQGAWNIVTDVVRAHVQGGRLRIHANNTVLGGDPIERVPKQLVIRYRVGAGDETEATFDESDEKDPDEPWVTLP